MMISDETKICPACGRTLKYYDSVQRIVRTKFGAVKQIKVRRMHCSECKKIHRVIPTIIFPHKQYESEIINGVLEGLITSDTLGYEDYPCEMTMIRWKAQKIQLLL